MGYKERWKDIKGYKGCYQVSNKGRVKSLKRFVTRTDGRKQPIPEVILTGDRGEYIRIRLRTPLKSERVFVHRLVGEYFLRKPQAHKKYINHKNGKKYDNRATNLKWCTMSENVKHAYQTKLHIHAKGEDWHNSKLNNKKVLFIRKEYAKGIVTQLELANKFGVSRRVVGKLLARQTWKHI